MFGSHVIYENIMIAALPYTYSYYKGCTIMLPKLNVYMYIGSMRYIKQIIIDRSGIICASVKFSHILGLICTSHDWDCYKQTMCIHRYKDKGGAYILHFSMGTF